MKSFKRKEQGFMSCMPDVFLATIFIAVAGIVVYYAYTSEQQKVLAKQNMVKIINKNKTEINKQNLAH